MSWASDMPVLARWLPCEFQLSFCICALLTRDGSVLNLIVGVNGLKMWARAKREQKETLAQVEEAAKDDKYVDEKGPLLAN